MAWHDALGVFVGIGLYFFAIKPLGYYLADLVEARKMVREHDQKYGSGK